MIRVMPDERKEDVAYGAGRLRKSRAITRLAKQLRRKYLLRVITRLARQTPQERLRELRYKVESLAPSGVSEHETQNMNRFMNKGKSDEEVDTGDVGNGNPPCVALDRGTHYVSLSYMCAGQKYLKTKCVLTGTAGIVANLICSDLNWSNVDNFVFDEILNILDDPTPSKMIVLKVQHVPGQRIQVLECGLDNISWIYEYIGPFFRGLGNPICITFYTAPTPPDYSSYTNFADLYNNANGQKQLLRLFTQYQRYCDSHAASSTGVMRAIKYSAYLLSLTHTFAILYDGDKEKWIARLQKKSALMRPDELEQDLLLLVNRMQISAGASTFVNPAARTVTTRQPIPTYPAYMDMMHTMVEKMFEGCKGALTYNR